MTAAIVARTPRDALETARNMRLTGTGSWLYVDRAHAMVGHSFDLVVWVDGWTETATTVAALRALGIRRTPRCRDLYLPQPSDLASLTARVAHAQAELDELRKVGKPPASPFVSPEALAVLPIRHRRRGRLSRWLRGER